MTKPKVNWKLAYGKEVEFHAETRKALLEKTDAMYSSQRQRGDFEREARIFRDLAETRRREVEVLTTDKADLAGRLIRRNADFELLSMLIRKYLERT